MTCATHCGAFLAKVFAYLVAHVVWALKLWMNNKAAASSAPVSEVGALDLRMQAEMKKESTKFSVTSSHQHHQQSSAERDRAAIKLVERGVIFLWKRLGELFEVTLQQFVLSFAKRSSCTDDKEHTHAYASPRGLTLRMLKVSPHTKTRYVGRATRAQCSLSSAF